MVFFEEGIGDFYLLRRVIPSLGATLLHASIPILDLIDHSVFLCDLLSLFLLALFLCLESTYLPTKLLHLSSLYSALVEE